MTYVDPATVRRIADMHAVYRMFDEAGRLLYVGISGRARRFDDHAVKRWFPLVSLITLEWHATHAAAALAEKRAIATEKPRYNIACSPIAKRADTRKPKTAKRDVLADILTVFGEDRNMHWAVVAERLARKFPDRWDGITRDVIRTQCRALAVPSVNVRMGTKVLSGCRKADIEDMVARKVLKSAS